MLDPVSAATIAGTVGTYVSPLIQVTLDKLVPWLLRKLGRKDNVLDKLKKLERTLTKILAIVDYIESKQIYVKSWQPWLRDLKAAAYEAEDIVDHLDQVCVQSGKITEAEKLDKVLKKLDGIAKEMEFLHKREFARGIPHEMRERPQTSSLIDQSSVFGREGDRWELVNLLLSNKSNAKNVSIISLVGAGGLGKTTLAQIVYNDKKVRTHFNLRMWVSVTEEFDVRKLTKLTIESVANYRRKKLASQSALDLMGLDPLQVTLQRLLRDQVFLLVLDDLWDVSFKDWENFKLPLEVGGPGSKILITTQCQTVSLTTGSKPLPLKGLSNEACWSLLQIIAFPNGIPDAHENLVNIGKKIVTKCAGLPLVAKTLGRLLNSITDEREWNAVWESDLWDLLEDNNDVSSSMWSSYGYLPPQLKQCFAYCSVFPKGDEFKKDMLVQLWMAQGFIQSKGARSTEDIGSSYFDNLLPFFQIQEADHDESDMQPRYQMHNLFHDIAQNVTRDEVFRMEDDKDNIFADFRHLSWCCKNNSTMTSEEKIKYGSFRTIRQKCAHGHQITHDTLFEQLTNVKYLRVLDLRRAYFKRLPEDIGNLKHLRYLDLSETLIQKLPKSVYHLHCLQTLKLEKCTELGVFEASGQMNFGNLTGLRHLYFDGCTNSVGMRKEIPKLTNLETLCSFKVGSGDGQNIREMKDMTNLRVLRISNLDQNVTNVHEAELHNKKYLHKLMLQWSNNGNVALHDVHLQNLKPHQNLKELYIEFYYGQCYPDWMTNSYNLVHVSLSICSKLPSLWRLPFLKSLVIYEVTDETYITEDFYGDRENGFPSLETLIFRMMPKLRGWVRVGQNGMQCLRQLTIFQCGELQDLPVLHDLNSLRFLEIDNLSLIGWMESHCPNWEKQMQHGDMEIYNRRIPDIVEDPESSRR